MKRRKFLLPILSVCMVVALVSVGFAAWLITGSDTSDTETGSFVTDTLNNAYFTAYVDFNADTPAADKGKIIFGKDGDPTTPWLDASTVPAQKMTATATVYIVPEDTTKANVAGVTAIFSAAKITHIKVTLAVADSIKAAFANCLNSNYIAAPTWTEGGTNGGSIAASSATELSSNAVYVDIAVASFSTAFDAYQPNGATGNVAGVKANATITFTWGTALGSKNPYTYLNGLSGGNTETNRAQATTILNAINALSATSAYSLSLSTVVSAS